MHVECLKACCTSLHRAGRPHFWHFHKTDGWTGWGKDGWASLASVKMMKLELDGFVYSAISTWPRRSSLLSSSFSNASAENHCQPNMLFVQGRILFFSNWIHFWEGKKKRNGGKNTKCLENRVASTLQHEKWKTKLSLSLEHTRHRKFA